MKFEKPIMNISMFEVENIVTVASGAVEPEKLNAMEAASTYLTGADATLTFTF